MKLSKRQRLLEAYYELTCYGGWHLVNAISDMIRLHKNATDLFDIEKEIFFAAPPADLTLYSNCTFELSGYFSWYDTEVLKSLKFTER
jgi:hypothetical protein